MNSFRFFGFLIPNSKLLQEAMTSIDPDAKLKDEEEEEEATNGAGRGKDMQVFNE